MKTTNLLALLYCLTLSGCVFISEPDVGASSAGPEFQNEDPGQHSDGLPPDEAAEPMDGSSLNGGDPNSSNNRFEDSGLTDGALETDATVSPSDASSPETDADITNPDVSTLDMDDAGQPFMADGSTGMVDMEVTPDPDMMVVDPPVESCDDIIWDCSRNGYCDPLDRPDCALSPGSPACYPFTNLTQTDPAAYARCCAREGQCMGGNFCEPEELNYCWLLGEGPTCYIRSNPISEYICR